MRRLIFCFSAVALVTGFVATPRADAQQTVNFYVGGFSPRGFDSRGTDDVLFQNANFLTFDMKDFNSATVGAEWLVGAQGEAREAVSPSGLVFVRGALWRATTSGAPIPAGAPVTVIGRKGLELEVAPAEPVPAPETAEEKK